MRVALLTSLLALTACASDAPADAADAPPGAAPRADGVAAETSTVTVDYRVTLPDGAVVDEGRRTTFSLLEVVPGFQAGVAGMRVGQTKRFDVAPEDGYGPDGIPGQIPPATVLTFEVTLHGVE